MGDTVDEMILRPKFRPADFAPSRHCDPTPKASKCPAGNRASASVLRVTYTPQKVCETPQRWKGVGPAILGTTDNLCSRSGKKHYGSVLNFCDPNGGKENVDRPCGKRVCSTTLCPSSLLSPARPLALSTLSAAYNNTKPCTQRRHTLQDSSPQEFRMRGIHVAPTSSQPTDTIVQLSLPPRPRPASASSQRCSAGYAPRQFNPTLLAVHGGEEVLRDAMAQHERLNSSRRYRPRDIYEATAAQQEEVKAGRRSVPDRNASAKDVICSKYAPACTPERVSYSQESRARYQQALNEARKDTITLKEVAHYHRVRGQVSSLTFTSPLYECRETPMDLLPLTAR